MPTNRFLRVATTDDGITTVTLDHGKVNALCVGLLVELEATALRLADEARSGDVRVVVVTGGPKVFAAGADITEFAVDVESDPIELASAGRVGEIGQAFIGALGAVEALPCPTIASVAGVALGGGCELALACDLRVASDRARFGQPEILLGIIPGGGGTQRLARLIGASRAKDLILTGRQVDASEALSMGLVNRVVGPDDLDRETTELAAALAASPRRAIALAKSAIDGGIDLALADGIQLEAERFVESFATPDAAVGVGSFLRDGPGRADFRSC